MAVVTKSTSADLPITGAGGTTTANDIILIPSSAGIGGLVNGQGGIDEIRFDNLSPFTLDLGAFSSLLSIEAVVLGTGSGPAAVTSGTVMLSIDASDYAANGLILTGNAGDNSVTGTNLVDTITGGAGADSLVGGGGNDVFILFSADDSLGDVFSGGAGLDEIRFASTNTEGETLFLDPAADVDSVVIGTGTAAAAITTGIAPHDIIASGLSTSISLFGNAGENMLVGGAGNDFIQGGGGNDMLFGGDGNETIDGGAGADYADGENGADTYWVQLATDLVAGDLIADSGDDGANDRLDVRLASGVLAIGTNISGIEIINAVGATATSAIGINVAAGYAASLAINGNAAANALTGGAGDDTIAGGGGADVLTGGAGNDLFLVGNQPEAVGDVYVGGTGNDTVRFDPVAAPTLPTSTFTIGATSLGVERYELVGSQAYHINAAALTAANATRLVGNSAANSVIGGLGSDTLEGGDGADTLRGGAGEDTFLVLQASDYDAGEQINGELGNDSLRFDTALAETLVLAGGPATVSLEAVVLGGSADSGIDARALTTSLNIQGNSGGNVIVGSRGTDVITGGAGNDVIIVNNGFSGRNDQVNGGADSDQVRFTSTTRGDTLTVKAGTSGIESFVISDQAGSTAGTLALNVNATAASAGVNVAGNDGANFITGSNFGDSLSGNGGNDTLDGRSGHDLLAGGAGADHLLGQSGNDTLVGGAGNDFLNGGTGNDTADYGAESASVTANLTTGSATGSASGTDTLSQVENLTGTAFADSLTGSGGANVILGLAGNDTLSGLAGHDTIDGGAGADTIAGGVGNDLLSAGVDPLTTFRVTDTLDYSAATSGVTVNLGTFTVSNDGQGGSDTLVNDVAELERFERVVGSGFADSITGSDNYSATSNLWQSKQTDLTEFYVGGGGNDTINGGGGTNGHFDYVMYNNAGAGVSVYVNLGSTSITTVAGVVAGGTARDASGTGTIGTDTLVNIDGARGTISDDILVGGSSERSLNGSKFESFEGGAGNDTIAGNAAAFNSSGAVVDAQREYDRADYINANLGVGVDVNLATGVGQDGLGGIDTLWDITQVRGSIYNDTLTGGNTANNFFEGFEGREGNDSINGGAGFDRAEYTVTNGTGINANLSGGQLTMQGSVVVASGTVTDGFGAVDTLVDVEAIRGSDFADWIVLSGLTSLTEEATGRAGNDTLDGGGGNDRVSYNFDHDGGAGALADNGYGVAVNLSGAAISTAEYASLTLGNFGVSSLAAYSAIDGWGGTDSVLNFENIRGSIYNDLLVGSAGSSTIEGLAGNDTLSAGADAMGLFRIADTLDYNQAASGVVVNLGTFTVSNDGFGGMDVLVNDAAELERFERVTGSDFADSITGSDVYAATSNLFQQKQTDMSESYYGGMGNDTLDGGGANGGHFDSASYFGATEAVFAYLGSGSITTGAGAIAGGTARDASGTGNIGTDTLINIEAIRGTASSDVLVGGGGSLTYNGGLFESFDGGAGNDTIAGNSTSFNSSGASTSSGDTDRADYLNDPNAVNINLATGVGLDGFGGIDTLWDIGVVRGSNFGDTLTGGNALNNGFEAFDGRAGNDLIDGGAGFDRVDYSFTNGGGVNVNLSATQLPMQGGLPVQSGTATDGLGYIDTLLNIEAVRGSDYDDWIVFSNNAAFTEEANGRAGDDTLEGLLGQDRLTYVDDFDGGGGALSGNGYGVVVNLSASEITGEEYGRLEDDSYYGVTEVGSNRAVDGWGGVDQFSGFEHVRGSEHGDLIVGSAENNFLEGRAGDDWIDAGAGWDTVVGGAGNDLLGAGVDLINQNGQYRIVDTLSFGGALSGVTVNLQTLTVANDGFGGVDMLVNDEAELQRFEHVSGSSFADYFTGSDVYSPDSNLWQSRQVDLIELFYGGGGNDTIDGGGATAGHMDIAQYNSATEAVYAYLGSGSITAGAVTVAGGTARGAGTNGGSIGIDTLLNIDVIWGSSFNDVLVGGGDQLTSSMLKFESFIGGAGNDTIAGNAAAFNSSGAVVDAQLEFDRADYDSDPYAVNVNLATGIGLDGYGGSDSLWDIGFVRGSHYNDTLTGGNVLNDRFEGFEGHIGNDWIDGGSGFDRVHFTTGNMGVNVNLSSGQLTMQGGVVVDAGTATDGWGGVDTMLGIEGARGGDFGDWIVLSDGTAFIEEADGKAGNDTLDGGGGNDRVSHIQDHDGGGGALSGNGYGVVVNLSTNWIGFLEYSSFTFNNFGAWSIAGNSAIDGWGGIDTLIGIENIRGSSFRDLLVGGAGSSTIEGFAGNDTLSAGVDQVTTVRITDVLEYSSSTGGVIVNLGTFTVANDGFGGTDTLVNDAAELERFERVSGSNYADSITGSDIYSVTSNLWQSKATDMTEFYSGNGGDDTLDGGGATAGHFDQASYFGVIEAVFVNLGGTSITTGAGIVAAGTARDASGSGFIGTDTLVNIDGVRGTSSDDVLVGGSGSLSFNLVRFEQFDGGAGNDTIAGNALAFNTSGAEITFLSEFDRADYINDPSAVNVNLATGIGLDGWGGTDTLWDMTEVRGSNYNDTLTGGNVLQNNFEGFEGRGGDDTIDGGSGFDRSNYSFTNGNGVNVNLSAGQMTMQGAVVVDAGTATDGLGGVDTLISIESIRGGDFDDWIVLSSTTFFTEEANGRAGNDTMDGGLGSDRATYDNDIDGGGGMLNGNGYGVVVNLSGNVITTAGYASLTAGNFGTTSVTAGTGIDGWGGVDTLINFESIRASNYGDLLVGSTASNFFEGRGGDDTIDGGGGGFDQVGFGSALGAVWVDLVSQTSTGEGSDTFSGIQGAFGGNFNDTLLGDGNANNLAGGFGSDTMTGGAGADTFFFNSFIGVTQDGLTNVDTITDFVSASDRLFVDDAFFTSTGVVGSGGGTMLLAGSFVSGAFTSGQDAGDRFIYNTSTGNLYYDADGSGGGASILFGTLTGAPTLVEADFRVN